MDEDRIGRLDRAKRLIAIHPDWGKRKVAKQLREEYGEALRWDVILSLKRAYKAGVTIAKARVLKRPPKLKKMQHYRFEALRYEGFLRREALFFSKFQLKQSFMRAMRRDARQGKMVRFHNLYEMLRYYRQKSIDEGFYEFISLHPRRKRQPVDKGDVKAQRRRRRERQKEERKIGEVVFDEGTQKFQPRFY